MLTRQDVIFALGREVVAFGKSTTYTTLADAVDGARAALHLGFKKVTLMIAETSEDCPTVDGDSIFGRVVIVALSFMGNDPTQAFVQVDGNFAKLDSIEDLKWVVVFE